MRELPEISKIVDTPIQSACIVLNPVAGRGSGAKHRDQLLKLMDSKAGHSIEWKMVESTSGSDTESLAREAAGRGTDLVVAAGGDGTINQVVNGIAGSKSMLGIIPLGTGNDFARMIEVNSFDLAVHTLLHGKKKIIDLGRLGERLFINIAGCGFDAVVGEAANLRFRKLHGTFAYIAAAIYSLITFRAASFRITLDGELLETKAMLCSIANARSYGGGMLIAPDAVLDDGLLDVCILGEVSKFEFLRAFPRVYKGTHVSHPAMRIVRAKKVEITSDPIMPMFIDGELVGKTPGDFMVIPGALEVMVPDSHSII